MLVSTSKKFVCLNPPKTGSGFRERVLEPFCDIATMDEKFPYPQKMRRHLQVEDSNKFLQHKQIDTSDWFWFTFTRNPWAQMQSWYRMRVVKQGAEQAPDFETFISEVCSSNLNSQDFYLQRNGKWLDFIGTQENLVADMQYISDMFDLNLTPEQLKTKNNLCPGEINFKNKWTPQLIQTVGEFNKLTIQLKDYKFEGH